MGDQILPTIMLAAQAIQTNDPTKRAEMFDQLKARGATQLPAPLDASPSQQAAAAVESQYAKPARGNPNPGRG